MMKKKGQEEMVGFAVILILVAVILAVLIGFMVRKQSKSVLQSYEISSFIESMLKYTSECEDYMGYEEVQEVILSCKRNLLCLNGKSSCEVLNSTIESMINSSWNINPESPNTGYRLKINVDETDFLILQQGVSLNSSYISDSHQFVGEGNDYSVSLRIYN